MQTIHSIQDCRILLVTLPEGEDGAELQFDDELNETVLLSSNSNIHNDTYLSHRIPQGNWHPVNFIDKVTEQESQQIVEMFGNGGIELYKDYTFKYTPKLTAHESLLSLCRSLGHEPSNTFLLIEKK